MSWPSPHDFSSMFGNPEGAFRDPPLKACRIEMERPDTPRAWYGTHAVVYRAIVPGGTPLALRVFSGDSSDRSDHYQRIGEFLRERKMPRLADFEYQEAAICSASDGRWYPMMIMDWVEGATLFDYVRARSLGGKPHSIAKAAKHWAALVDDMAKAQVAHGDLEPANVIVTKSGKLKLVDYDALCVPSLVGRSSPEAGTSPYQHPSRTERTPLSLEIDRFPALAIYVALRALATDPGLWMKRVESVGHGGLLFQAKDYQNPSASPLYRALRTSTDRDVRRLSKVLFASAKESADNTPPLAEVLADMNRSTIRGSTVNSDHSEGEPDVAEHSNGAKVVLQVVSGPIRGKEFTFDRHDTFLFGRGEDCHARITGDPRVSRHHFLLEVIPPRVRIRDLGSRNGVFINGKRCGGVSAAAADYKKVKITPIEADLKPGDRVTVGRTTIYVRVELNLVTAMPGARAVAAEKNSKHAIPAATGLAAYELGDSLGNGPLGTVYRAVQRANGQAVAVKVVRPTMHVDDSVAMRFLDEVRATACLQHSGIADLLDLGWQDESFYFVSRYVNGKNLSVVLDERKGPLTLAAIRPLLTQCLDALDHAHGLGFVHRDIKPENILMENRGGPWFATITDFGLANHLEAAGFSGLKATGNFDRLFQFLPREQLTGFQNSEPLSDLWSLAAVFYHALTGKYPFDFRNRDPLAVILHDEPVPLVSRNPAIPHAVAAVIDRALASDMRSRFPSAAKMSEALESAYLQAGERLR